MLRSIAAQTEARLYSNTSSPELERLYEACRKFGHDRGPTLDETVGLLKSYEPFVSKIYIVLDALDECLDRDNLLGTLVTLMKPEDKFQIFMTSRRERAIIDGLMTSGVTPMSIPEDALKHDLNIFLTSAFHHDAHLRRLPDGLKDLCQKVLSDRAGSM